MSFRWALILARDPADICAGPIIDQTTALGLGICTILMYFFPLTHIESVCFEQHNAHVICFKFFDFCLLWLHFNSWWLPNTKKSTGIMFVLHLQTTYLIKMINILLQLTIIFLLFVFIITIVDQSNNYILCYSWLILVSRKYEKKYPECTVIS